MSEIPTHAKNLNVLSPFRNKVYNYSYRAVTSVLVIVSIYALFESSRGAYHMVKRNVDFQIANPEFKAKKKMEDKARKELELIGNRNRNVASGRELRRIMESEIAELSAKIQPSSQQH